jgi:hypothetical protein
MTKEKQLMEYVKKFIKKQEITCDECIYQCDHVIENAYEFIEGCCDIAGYHEGKN